MFFINQPKSSKDLTIFIMFFITLFDIISFFIPDPNVFLWIPASAAEAEATVNPNWISTLLVNDLSTFFIDGRSTFSNGPRSLPRNPPNCSTLDIWVFDDFISFDDLSAKALRRFLTYLSVKKTYLENYFFSTPIMSDDNLRVMPVAVFAVVFTQLKFC